MKKRIFIMGQCTLHWGRMEFGNIGNYYIVKPMFEELRRLFPEDELVTTMQFSEEFCDRFDLNVVPMEYYYDFERIDNLENAKKEYFSVCDNTDIDSKYVEEVKKADLVIDFSGDIWGDNADFLGKDRFLTGLYKDLIAQQLKPTVMICGSPGPFNNQKNTAFIKRVFAGFDLVINREHISTRMLKAQGFDMSNVQDFACPSFLFQGSTNDQVAKSVMNHQLMDRSIPKIGIMLCGWNFEKGPFDLWPRNDCEYERFVKTIENLIKKYNVNIYLLSHSNGFDIPPAPFRLKHGRDFPIMQQLFKILNSGTYSDKITLLKGVYTPEITKGIISNFDMLISGRMHGAVAGLSQAIPTVIVDYGHEPKAHKLQGFAEVVGTENYIASPNDLRDMLEKTESCFENREVIHEYLEKKMIKVKENSKKQFECLKMFLE